MSSQDPLARHAATPAEVQKRLEAARSGVPFLVLDDADGRQVLFLLGGPASTRLTIGRRATNDLALPWDEQASRVHAELENVGGDWVLIDDGLSSNGTWVNEARVVGRRRLRGGDVIRVGETRIAFCAPSETSAATARGDDGGSSLHVSPAQRRVLVALCRPQLLGDAYAAAPTNQQLADELFLSVAAVKSHLKALFEAFGLDAVPQIQKRATLVERAVRLGVVTERDVRQGLA
jgi:pSer/pThr/pTyr-binding forkhead associated (FHA) protein